jgi:hypothetical protein
MINEFKFDADYIQSINNGFDPSDLVFMSGFTDFPAGGKILLINLGILEVNRGAT